MTDDLSLLDHTSYPFWFEESQFYLVLLSCRAPKKNVALIGPLEAIEEMKQRAEDGCRYTTVTRALAIVDPFRVGKLISEKYGIKPTSSIDEGGNYVSYLFDVRNQTTFDDMKRGLNDYVILDQ